MTKNLLLILTIAIAATAADKKPAPPKLKEFKPSKFNFFSLDQDIQLGKEAAAQVEQQYEVVKNAELEGFIMNIGRKLAAQPQANGAKFPYSFKVVSDNSVNAFALPGGSAFIHTGLIAKADNEAQIAAVLAHEISHVALRHGTHQSSKANLIQIPAAMAAQMAGGSGGLLGTLESAGIGLLANGAMMKFSRSAENEADLLGAQIMSQAGYNPIEMARFFEKLEAETGKGNWVTNMMSDHPNPGNRVKNVEEQILALPRRDYMNDAGGLARAQAIVKSLPPPKKKVAPAASAPAPANAPLPGLEELRPSRNFKTSQNNAFSIAYPDNWQLQTDPQGGSVTIAPAKGAIGQGQQMQLGYGAQFNFTASNGQTVEIQAATQSLVQALTQGDPNMKVVQNASRTQVDGYQGMVTYLSTASPFKGQTESDMLLTVALPQGVFWAVFVAPASDFSNVQPAFAQMIQSLKFAR